jgi:hypothetical protein
MEIDHLEYAPTTGVKGSSEFSVIPILISQTALRAAVADMYNDTYRKGMATQYTFENVCIVPGGRAGLSRVAAVVGDVYVSLPLLRYI